MTGECRGNGNKQFWGTGAHAHYGEPYDEVADFSPLGDCHRSIYEVVGSVKEQKQAYEQ